MYYTIVGDQDGHEYIIREDKADELRDYFDNYYALYAEGKHEEADNLDEPDHGELWEGQRLYFKEWEFRPWQ